MNLSPAKQFTKKDGTPFFLRTMTVYDANSRVSVKLWDEKETLPELLAFNLKRLKAMRETSEKLFSRDLLNLHRLKFKGNLTAAEQIVNFVLSCKITKSL